MGDDTLRIRIAERTISNQNQVVATVRGEDLSGNGIRTEAHNLHALSEVVRLTYFPSTASLAIRWGQCPHPQRKLRSIRLGSYNHRTREIRIHPRLDHPDVPSFFIESIIHHEYLHHLAGARHDRRFHELERGFRLHRQSRQWLREHLPFLLGRRKRVAARPQAPAPVVTEAVKPKGRFLQLFLF